MAGRVKKCPNFIKNGQKLPSQAAFALTLYDLFRLLHDPHGLLAAKKHLKIVITYINMIGLCVGGQFHKVRE